ncbi:phage portal protein [Bacillus seohaeanensis]|uniref:Phage portal protein n=1 Tax=Bacillus seohaeanensis TaxID=284580 RepID=A0ABW5RRA1_9BACI
MLFRRAEKRDYTFTLADEEAAKILGIELDGISVDKAKEATFFTCLRILSDTISKLPLKLHQETGNGTRKATDHYLYNLLKLRPNEYMSSSTFFKAVEWNRLYYGHSIVYIDTIKAGRHAGRVKGLYPLDMDKVEIWVDDKGVIDRNNAIWYIYNTLHGQMKLKHDEVLHFFGMTKDGIQGMAVKDYLKTLVENAQGGQSYVNEYFKNGLFAKGILQYTSQINPEDEVRMKERFQRMASGVKNSGSILPVPLGFQFQSINSTMADSQFLELNQLSMQQIAAAFGVKMHQINSLDRATHSNIAEQQKEFYVDTLQSILVMYEQELSWKLCTKKERNEGYFWRFNVDSILRSSPKERAEYLKIMGESGYISRNEGREQENLPRVDDKNADTLILNGNAIPIDMVGEQYIKETSPKGGEDNE